MLKCLNLNVHFTYSVNMCVLGKIYIVTQECKYVDLMFSNCGACPPGSTVGPLGGGAQVCMRNICILNDILGQDKIYILVGTSLV
jgi:hypothetical protein